MARNGGSTMGRMMSALRWLMAPERLDEEPPPPPRTSGSFVSWLLKPESLDSVDSGEPLPDPASFRNGPVAFLRWVLELDRLDDDPGPLS